MDQFAQGASAYTEVVFTDDDGNRVDPPSLQVTRLDPNNDEQITDSTTWTRLGQGLYRFSAFLPASAEVGLWRDFWHSSGPYNGYVEFEVLANVIGDFVSVAEAAILESGLTYDLFQFADDGAFKSWVNYVAQKAITYLVGKLGNGWTLDNESYFEAATYETISRMLARLIMRSSTIVVAHGTSYKLGNFSVNRGSVQTTMSDLNSLKQDYHYKALAALGAPATRYAGIKVIVVQPEDRTFVI